MPSIFTHAVAGLALGTALAPRRAPLRVWLLGAACAMAPDLDAIGFHMGLRSSSPLGHRGLTHSLAVALLLGGLVTVTAFGGQRWRGMRGRLFVYYVLATASHGLLDAFTNGGSGVAFFAPFDYTRYFFPVRPIRVAPMSAGAFFSSRGLAVFRSELFWVWLPSLAVAAAALLARRPWRSGSAETAPR